MFFTSPPAFGFEMPNDNYTNNNVDKSSWKTTNISNNFSKFLGYNPFFGFAIGQMRIEAAKKHPLPNKFNHIVRGCIESFGLGFLLLIPDIILTGYREYQIRYSREQNGLIV